MNWNGLMRFCVVVVAGCYPCLAQQGVGSAPEIKTPSGPDPLSVGKAAMLHGDYAQARTFFAEYVAGNPADTEARFDLGSADLGLKDFAAAVKEFQAVIAAKPDMWAAHQNTALAYAEMQDWADFDAELAVIKTARDHNAPGLDKDGGDVIDVLQVGSKMYSVRSFYTLHGQYHTRYVFLHFGDDGKLTDYIQCESDDADQYSFKQSHPKEAAAGGRTFSLDVYTVGEKGMSQALIKFYSGEPTYEMVREDALKVLQGQAKPTAAMTSPKASQ